MAVNLKGAVVYHVICPVELNDSRFRLSHWSLLNSFEKERRRKKAHDGVLLTDETRHFGICLAASLKLSTGKVLKAILHLCLCIG